MNKDNNGVFNPIAKINNQKLDVLKNAKGVNIYDEDGNRYLDGVSSLWCMNIGYGREEIALTMQEAVKDIGGYFQTFSGSTHKSQILLANKILEKANESNLNMKKVFFGLTGSDANDTQIKLSRYYHSIKGNSSKVKVISQKGSYHGCSFLTASIGGIQRYKENFSLSQDEVIIVDCPNYEENQETFQTSVEYEDYLCAKLEQTIIENDPNTIACYIAEPIIGVGGVIIPPKNYFSKIKIILKKYDILLLIDEVICAFGRCGDWFLSGKFKIEADMISLAKGLTSAYFPMSAVIISEKIIDELSELAGDSVFCHGFTYSGHPTGCAVALKTIEILENENLINNSNIMGAYIKKELENKIGNIPQVKSIRGEGLLIGIEYTDDSLHIEVAADCKKKGLWIRALPYLPVTAIAPPLIFTKSNADELLEIYINSLKNIIKEKL